MEVAEVGTVGGGVCVGVGAAGASKLTWLRGANGAAKEHAARFDDVVGALAEAIDLRRGAE